MSTAQEKCPRHVVRSVRRLGAKFHVLSSFGSVLWEISNFLSPAGDIVLMRLRFKIGSVRIFKPLRPWSKAFPVDIVEMAQNSLKQLFFDGRSQVTIDFVQNGGNTIQTVKEILILKYRTELTTGKGSQKYPIRTTRGLDET